MLLDRRDENMAQNILIEFDNVVKLIQESWLKDSFEAISGRPHGCFIFDKPNIPESFYTYCIKKANTNEFSWIYKNNKVIGFEVVVRTGVTHYTVNHFFIDNIFVENNGEKNE
jgi:hypothetical protein